MKKKGPDTIGAKYQIYPQINYTVRQLCSLTCSLSKSWHTINVASHIHHGGEPKIEEIHYQPRLVL
jgi:hypothetical protein